jgi:hypothetical protein
LHASIHSRDKLEEEEKSGRDAVARAKAHADDLQSMMETKLALLQRERDFNDKRWL